MLKRQRIILKLNYYFERFYKEYYYAHPLLLLLSPIPVRVRVQATARHLHFKHRILQRKQLTFNNLPHTAPSPLQNKSPLIRQARRSQLVIFFLVLNNELSTEGLIGSPPSKSVFRNLKFEPYIIAFIIKYHQF